MLSSRVALVILFLVSAWYPSLGCRPRVPLTAAELAAEAEAERQALQLEAHAERLLISTGPISRPQKILGQVTVGSGDFEAAGLERSPENLDKLMRSKAVGKYGFLVDAIINASTTVTGGHMAFSMWSFGGVKNVEGDAFATGIAVKFLDDE